MRDPSTERPLPAAVLLCRIPPDEAVLQPRFDELSAALAQAQIPYALLDSFYDLHDDAPAWDALRAFAGELLILGWHFPRAMRWALSHHGLDVNRVRSLDAREGSPADVVRRVREILPSADAAPALPVEAALEARWYPVVDYDRCTNCMDCIDFCLFGVYGVDGSGVLRVTRADQCRVDCPACARVCPAEAIIFPKYRSQAVIAGGDKETEVVVSKPPAALHAAALERDRALLDAGRKPPGADKMEKLAADFEKLEL